MANTKVKDLKAGDRVFLKDGSTSEVTLLCASPIFEASGGAWELGLDDGSKTLLSGNTVLDVAVTEGAE